MSPIAAEQEEAYLPPSVEIVVGPYKEQATDPNAYDRKLEEEGFGDVPGVTVCSRPILPLEEQWATAVFGAQGGLDRRKRLADGSGSSP